MNLTMTEGTWARVRLHRDRPGAGRPRHPAEDGVRVEVTVVSNPGDHSVFALYKGGGRPGVPRPGVGLGRYFRPDELEPIPKPR